MNVILKYLSDIRVVIGLAVLIVLIMIILIVQKIKSGKARRQLEDLEDRYNAIKKVPLSFKLNKAVAISRIVPDAMTKVTNMKDDFDKAEANLKQIGQALADTEDEIIAGKLKKAKLDLEDLEVSVSLGEEQVEQLDSFLDSILEKEEAQRQQANEYKNRFRELKEQANANRGQLSGAWDTIEQVISETERMFSNCEDWMYASDFEKANAELANIEQSLERFEGILNAVPSLLEDARGVIPKMAEVVHHDYTEAYNRGVYLKHLQVEQNLSVITNGLRSDLEQLKTGDSEGVRENLDDYKERLTQLEDQIQRECEAYDQMNALANENAALYKEAEKNVSYLANQYARLSGRFGLDGMDRKIGDLQQQLASIASRMPKVYTLVQENQNPATGLVASMKELNQDLTSLNNTAALRSTARQAGKSVRRSSF